MKIPDEILSSFYANYFPYDYMFKWLSYGDDSSFKKREFSFTTEEDVYMRYKSFENGTQFKKEMLDIKPRKLDIGAVFTLPPPQHKQVQPGAFFPIFKEFVLDIDISDYDNVRFCGCKEAKFCKICWSLMACGMNVLDLLLSECFAFEKKLWVYSGRRGVHCWVCDEEARNLDNESRAAVTEFLHIYNGSEKSGKKLTISPKYPHPTFSIDSNVYEICEKYFQEIYCEDYSMNIFESPDKWNLILDLLSDNDTKLRIELKTYLESATDTADGAEIWSEIKKKLKQFKREGYIPYIVYSFVYPRLDANVSKQLNHLLKSPFCVHPSTESICVPISNDEFYPEYDCPTVRLLTEGNEESKERWERAMKYFIKFVKKAASSKYIKPEPNENDKMELDF